MLDLGTGLLASVERDPMALAVVDGATRLTYAQWYPRILAAAAGLEGLGLRQGDHLVTALQNRWEAATLHWACQVAGIIATPLNWRATEEDVAWTIADAGARAVVCEQVSAAAGAAAVAAGLPCVNLDAHGAGETGFDQLCAGGPGGMAPRARAEDWSVMLYTSGTTSRPKGVPRRHRAERAAALAHVAQNLYGRGERTLGVMPLYHTMGVRSLIAMSLLGGTFVCLPRFDVAAALRLIAAEGVTNLYLVPTLYHDMLAHPDFVRTDVSSVRKLGFAGAPMTDGLLQRLSAAFRPELLVNHYGSSEVYTCTVEPAAARKPGSAGRAGLNQRIRVSALHDHARPAAVGEEGQILAWLAGDEAFEGYWRRPDADAKSLCDGWYLTGDTGYLDAEGDLFVTGRVDDMIITGGENVSPVEVESCLSRHPGVSEVAVVGLPDERWGKVVTAFVKPRTSVSAEELDRHCLEAGLARFKRPRRFVFLAELPRSPVGKLLRRKLVETEPSPTAPETATKDHHA